MMSKEVRSGRPWAQISKAPCSGQPERPSAVLLEDATAGN